MSDMEYAEAGVESSTNERLIKATRYVNLDRVIAEVFVYPNFNSPQKFFIFKGGSFFDAVKYGRRNYLNAAISGMTHSLLAWADDSLRSVLLRADGTLTAPLDLIRPRAVDVSYRLQRPLFSGGAIPAAQCRIAVGNEVLIANIAEVRLLRDEEPRGAVAIRGEIGPAFGKYLPPGFRYLIKNASGSQRSVDFPLFEAAGDLTGMPVTIVWDPLDPRSPARNFIQLTPRAGGWASRYRTGRGSAVHLNPLAAGAYPGRLFADPDTGFLRPTGTFDVLVAGEDAAPKWTLQAGTQADEFFTLPRPATLVFADEPAGLLAEEGGGLRPVAGAPPVAWTRFAADWHVESGIGLFRPPGSADHNLMVACPLFERTVDATSFTLLPFTPVHAAAGLTDDQAKVENLFARHRRREILTGSPGGRDEVAYTAEGHAVRRLGGIPVQIVLARSALGDAGTDIAVAFGSADGRAALPAELCEAVLGTDGLVVATTMPGSAGFSGKADIAGWSFSLALPEAHEAPPTGDFPVLIVKFCDGALAALLAAPAAWKSFDYFNSTRPGRPRTTAAYVAAQMAACVAAAREDLRRGVHGLAPLIDALDNPFWRGVLLLRCPFSRAASVNNEVTDLLNAVVGQTSIRPIAHHLGCAVGYLREDDSDAGWRVDTAFFGLLHYRDDTPPAPSAAPELRMAALDMEVEHSRIRRFTCGLRLAVPVLFGAATRGSGGSGPLVVTLDGALLSVNGQAQFVLASPPGETARAALASDGLDGVEIGNCRIARGDEGRPVALMSGWLATRANGGMDLLSYAGVSFEDLAIVIAAAAQDNRVDTSHLRLGGRPERLLAPSERMSGAVAARDTVYRPGSLAASMPVTIAGWVEGEKGSTPSDLGFCPLTTSSGAAGDSSGQSGRFDPAMPWRAITCELPLAGTQASQPAVGARLMLAWQDRLQGLAEPDIIAWIRLEGSDGSALSARIAGIAALGVKAFHLRRDGQDFALELSDIGVSILSLSFPPKGTTKVVLSGLRAADGTRQLGWMGRYARM